MVTATTFTAARPILQSILPGFPAPIVVVDDDPHGALLNELDDLIADLASALEDRDTAARRVTIVAERLALVRSALERENAGRTIQ